MIKLFHGWRSSASRRVRLCLAEKGLAYEGHSVDMLKGEQHAPEYLAMNPNGVVPTLIHDGRVLYESSTIAEYLDDVFPNPPLRPGDPYERAVMRNFVRYTDEKCLPNLIVFNWSTAMQPMASQWTDAQLQERLKNIPTQERRDAWTRVARKPFTDDEKAAAMKQLLALLDKMEGMMAGGGEGSRTESAWLVGATYSIADIAATPFVVRIAELNPEALAVPERARVRGWWARVQARPSFAVARFDPFDSPR